MAINLSGGRRGARRAPMAEINVTPLVDVMLVLLIIFMVTAPLLVAGVPVDLPDARAKSLPQDQAPIQISLDASGTLFIDRQAVPPAALPAKLAALRGARSDEARVYVRADRALDYGRVMAVVGEVNAAGFKKVALVTDTARDGARETP
ncbi:protein TolR [Sandarakinorhabdus rubra]|uniref:protein TolR n=1 Tax=Sandarakinorhabdus rubra TaxID=2672568 RepID=UPI00196A0F6C|nr:protein TolR [Sandarakinorhabdus rubra]